MKKVLAAIAFIGIISWQNQPTYTLKLTEQEIQLAIRGISKLPYEESAPLINKIIGQAQDSTLQKKK